MASTAAHAIHNLVSAARGAAGATAINRARHAEERWQHTESRVPGVTGTRAAAMTYSECVIAVATNSLEELDSHRAATTEEILKLTYAADDGNRVRTYDPVMPIGGGNCQIRDRDTGGVVAKYELMFRLVETSDVLLNSITDAAA